MKKLLRPLALFIVIVLISAFPVFMSPIRSIWEHKEDHKKVAQLDEQSEEEGIL